MASDRIRNSIGPAILAVLTAGPAVALDEMRFRAPGASDEVVAALGAASLLLQSANEGIRAPEDLLAAARADYARLVGALYSEGRFGGTVSIRIDGREAADIGPFDTPAEIGRIEVVVQSGPVYRFSEATVQPIAAGTEMPDDFRPGEVARTGAIRDAAEAAVDGWRAVGHAKAAPGNQRITANHADKRLAARVEIETGPRLRFGELVITGETAVNTRRLRKITGLPTGQVFDPAELNRAERRLRKTGVFRSAALIEAGQPNPDGTLDINLQVADQKPRRFGFGAEIESVEGLTLSAFWLHRNLLGGAERLRIDGEVTGIGGETGGVDYTLGLELGRPATIDAETDAVLSTELASLHEPDFSEDRFALGLNLIRQATDILTVRAGVELAYADVTDDTGQRTYRHLFLPLGATYDKREGILDTKDGYYIDLEIAPFLGLGGSESGVRTTLDARAYEDYGKDSRVVIAARLQAGSIAIAPIDGLPNDQRFYSGGGGTVRGQDYQSLEVDLGGGITSGGRSFLGLQSEVRTRVSDNISVVGFYDWGHVSADRLPGSGGESHAGAGLGLRYDTGIGPIRLDVAVPVSGPDDASGFQIYVGIGQAF